MDVDFERASETSACARVVDPYGDALFNQLQMPVLIDELASLVAQWRDTEFRERLGSALRFLRDSMQVSVYMRLTSD